MDKNVKEILKMANRMQLKRDDLIKESELVEEYGEYFHMCFFAFGEEELWNAAKLMYLFEDGGYIPAEGEEAEVLESYTNGTFLNMMKGTAVFEPVHGEYWYVLDNNGKKVVLTKVSGTGRRNLTSATKTKQCYELLGKKLQDKLEGT